MGGAVAAGGQGKRAYDDEHEDPPPGCRFTHTTYLGTAWVLLKMTAEDEPVVDNHLPLVEIVWTACLKGHTMCVMSDYGWSIVEVCMVCGFAASIVVTLLFRNSAWRLGIYLAGMVGVVVYIAIQPTGYDEWDRFEAIFFGGGAFIGWTVGYGVGGFSRSRRRVTALEKSVDEAVAHGLRRGRSFAASGWRSLKERSFPRREMPPLPQRRSQG